MLHTSRSFDSTRRKAIADYEASNPISSEDAYRALRAVDRPPTAQILEADLSASIYAAEDLLLKVKGRDTSLEGGLRRERKILKRIADGLAWKFFDEHFLLVSARQQSPGFMAGKAGYQNERHLVELVSKLGLPQISLVLQNDITNVLRYTDITILGSNGAIISYEVKSSPRGLRGSRAKRQASRGDAILEYLESGASKKLFSEPLRTVEHHLERRYYWTQLDQVASAAVRMGSAWQLVDGAMLIVAASTPKANHLEIQKFAGLIKKVGWLTSDVVDIGLLNNHFKFVHDDDILRFIIPLTSFEIKPSLVVRMIRDTLGVVIIVNRTRVAQELRRTGLLDARIDGRDIMIKRCFHVKNLPVNTEGRVSGKRWNTLQYGLLTLPSFVQNMVASHEAIERDVQAYPELLDELSAS